MRYLKTFEASMYEFDSIIKDWEKIKPHIKNPTKDWVDQDVEKVKKLRDQMKSLPKRSEERRIATRIFKKSYRYMVNRIRDAKKTINVTFTVGQKFEISKMYNFTHNTYHNTEKPDYDKCLNLDDYGLGTILAYSDIEIIDITPSGKTATLKFWGKDFRTHGGRFEILQFNTLREIKLRVSIVKLRVFYTNLMNDEYYQKVLFGKYAKKINEEYGWEVINGWKNLKTIFRDKDEVDKTIKKLNESYSKIQNKLDELLDKVGKKGFDSLTDKEKVFIKSFKNNTQEEAYENLTKKFYDDGIFKFELDRVEYAGDDRKRFHGTLTIDNKELKGYITRLSNGQNDPQFYDEDGKTLWDHAHEHEGIEYYLDDFIDNIIIDNE